MRMRGVSVGVHARVRRPHPKEFSRSDAEDKVGVTARGARGRVCEAINQLSRSARGAAAATAAIAAAAASTAASISAVAHIGHLVVACCRSHGLLARRRARRARAADTSAPARASPRAIALPRPWEPPVTNAVRPLREKSSATLGSLVVALSECTRLVAAAKVAATEAVAAAEAVTRRTRPTALRPRRRLPDVSMDRRLWKIFFDEVGV